MTTEGEPTKRRRGLHGLSRDPIHLAWRMMIARCHNPNHPAYPNYGGRGITVCDRWRASFYDFQRDMGPKPTPKHELDRTDNDAGYSPENCRWVTRSENDRNRRSTVWVEFRGERRKVADLCEEYGIPRDTLAYRLRTGWTPELAFTVPVRPKSPNGEHSAERYAGPGAEVFISRNAAVKRRHPKGEESVHAKLTEADVREIRRRNAAGETKASLAREFGVSEGNIWNIVKRVSWPHVLDVAA